MGNKLMIFLIFSSIFSILFLTWLKLFLEERRQENEFNKLYPKGTGYIIKITGNHSERRKIFKEQVYASSVLYRRHVPGCPLSTTSIWEIFYRPRAGTGIIYEFTGTPEEIRNKFSEVVRNALFWDALKSTDEKFVVEVWHK